MAKKQGLEIVLVRKSGPVRNMRFGSWFIGLASLILILVLAGLVAGGLLFYKQSCLLAEFGEQISLLMLRAERLEYLSQEQETREILAEEATKAKEKEPRQKPVEQSAVAAAEATATPTQTPQAPQEAEPGESDVVALSGISQEVEGGELVVTYAVTNKFPDGDRAEGYIVLVAHGQRQGKAWLESRPPMRMSALGRPINYRRGTPFAIQRYRRLTSRFALSDNNFERLEFLIYSRRGQLLLAHQETAMRATAAAPTAAPQPEEKGAAAAGPAEKGQIEERE